MFFNGTDGLSQFKRHSIGIIVFRLPKIFPRLLTDKDVKRSQFHPLLSEDLFQITESRLQSFLYYIIFDKNSADYMFIFQNQINFYGTELLRTQNQFDFTGLTFFNQNFCFPKNFYTALIL